VLWGKGFGASGSAVGEVCFNTAMTGYQEILTDPSYAAQIVTFTFPHIGNVGANAEDVESGVEGAVGCVVREEVTRSSSFRAEREFGDWLTALGKIGLAGIDTRALTRRIRVLGRPNAVIAHDPNGQVRHSRAAQASAGLARARRHGPRPPRLARAATRAGRAGHGRSAPATAARRAMPGRMSSRSITAPRTTSSATWSRPGAGDGGAGADLARQHPRAQARRRVPLERPRRPGGDRRIRGADDQGAARQDVPIFGICLGHQMLGLAAGAQTSKMHQGHRGANHPVKRLADGVVEITSMNHGFAVDNATLPEGVEETHVSLFDGSNCGIAIKGKKAFGVQYHPEASPGRTTATTCSRSSWGCWVNLSRCRVWPPRPVPHGRICLGLIRADGRFAIGV
jgi:carbamoyl-phosphate synthase small subunit